MQAFTIYPAIDLRQGKVVRLVQGDPARQTIYSDDPIRTAQCWMEAGAGWLHVVNLDGAMEQAGEASQKAVTAILQSAKEKPGMRVQVGGGVRTMDDISLLLSGGASRVVLGTAAIASPSFLATALEQFGPEQIAVSLDARAGQVQVRGWQADSGVSATTLAQELSKSGLRTVIYTNIQRDGTGQGIDLAGAQELAALTGLEVIASGGAASLDDVRLVRQAGLSGVIVGRALYDGRLDLKEALSWAQRA